MFHVVLLSERGRQLASHASPSLASAAMRPPTVITSISEAESASAPELPYRPYL